jgi:hypothetical protein
VARERLSLASPYIFSFKRHFRGQVFLLLEDLFLLALVRGEIQPYRAVGQIARRIGLDIGGDFVA